MVASAKQRGIETMITGKGLRNGCGGERRAMLHCGPHLDCTVPISVSVLYSALLFCSDGGFGMKSMHFTPPISIPPFAVTSYIKPHLSLFVALVDDLSL